MRAAICRRQAGSAARRASAALEMVASSSKARSGIGLYRGSRTPSWRGREAAQAVKMSGRARPSAQRRAASIRATGGTTPCAGPRRPGRHAPRRGENHRSGGKGKRCPPAPRFRRRAGVPEAAGDGGAQPEGAGRVPLSAGAGRWPPARRPGALGWRLRRCQSGIQHPAADGEDDTAPLPPDAVGQFHGGPVGQGGFADAVANRAGVGPAVARVQASPSRPASGPGGKWEGWAIDRCGAGRRNGAGGKHRASRTRQAPPTISRIVPLGMHER